MTSPIDRGTTPDELHGSPGAPAEVPRTPPAGSPGPPDRRGRQRLGRSGAGGAGLRRRGFLLASWCPGCRRPGTGSGRARPGSGWCCRARVRVVAVDAVQRAVVPKVRSRAVVVATTVAASVALVALAAVPTLVALGLNLFVWGSFYGSWDVAMNVHGSAVEQRAGREWMPRYHTPAGASAASPAPGCGALAAHAGMPLAAHFAAVAVLCAVLVMVALRSFIEDRTEVPEPTPPLRSLSPRQPPRRPPRRGRAGPLDPGFLGPRTGGSPQPEQVRAAVQPPREREATGERRPAGNRARSGLGRGC